jgi:proline iminopeptidase
MTSHFSSEVAYDHGMLDASDGNHVYYELRGNPVGTPLVIVHGGPGSGSPKGTPKSFDPERYLIILFDQRGCGRSTPHAADPSTSMRLNTTRNLIEDMERLRNHLGIDQWLMFGGSWGSGLSIEYAERFPQRVMGLVVASIWTMGHSEIDWLYRGGVGQLFPEEWARFVNGIPVELRTDDVVADYAELMENPSAAVRERAAIEWTSWEDAVLSLEPNGRRSVFGETSMDAMIAFVRICSTYAANNAWREEGALLRDARLLHNVPGSIIHGRLDLSCPLKTVWELASAWPAANLAIIDDAGHKGSPAMNQALNDAFASLT